MSLISGFLGMFGGRVSLFLIIPLLLLAGLSTARGWKIERLNERVGVMSAALAEAEAEKKTLRAALKAVSSAAQAQTAVSNLASQRRDKIDGLALSESTIARPDEVINEEKSRQIIDLFNNDIFGPLGRGLLENPGASTLDSVPGPAAANYVEPEPG